MEFGRGERKILSGSEPLENEGNRKDDVGFSYSQRDIY